MLGRATGATSTPCWRTRRAALHLFSGRVQNRSAAAQQVLRTLKFCRLSESNATQGVRIVCGRESLGLDGLSSSGSHACIPHERQRWMVLMARVSMALVPLSASAATSTCQQPLRADWNEARVDLSTRDGPQTLYDSPVFTSTIAADIDLWLLKVSSIDCQQEITARSRGMA